MNASVRDTKQAATVFALAAVGLVLSAAFGLTTWPAEPLAQAARSGVLKNWLIALHGYALPLCLLFWGARPSARAQRWVFMAWLVVAPTLWWLVKAQIDVGWFNSSEFSATALLATALAIPALLALIWRVSRTPTQDPHPELVVQLRWLLALTVLFMAVPSAALGLTATLHPYTFDSFALRWDHLLGLHFTEPLSTVIEAVPVLPGMVLMAYGLTPLAFLSVALLQLRQRPPHVASAVLTWVVLTLCAYLAYHCLPITGPKYVYGASYLQTIEAAERVPLGFVQVLPFPRNGMPSMHFGWCLAATILWWRSGTKAWSRGAMVFVTSLTMAATLYLGEHYAIDLIVAVPFVLAVIALCSTSVAWWARRSIVMTGFLSWLAWVLLIRLQTPLFIEHPWLGQLLLLATGAVAVFQGRAMSRFEHVLAPAVGSDLPPALVVDQRRLLRRFGLMFFCSGMAALVYQVLFAKELALVFGSMATATLTVLATFLGGMAIGSLIGGYWAHRSRRPLATYALVEVGIAGYCAATPAFFVAIQLAYVVMAGGLPPDAPQLLFLRVALGALVLLAPTVLMGTTLPLLAQAIGPNSGPIGSRVAWLYFSNTAGAAVGALLAAYAVIPAVGARGTTLVAAALNLLVALGALELNKRSPIADAKQTSPDADSRPLLSPTVRAAALLALGLGGALSLGLEVVYVHMLAIVAGNSVYAFGLMVATFLIGLAAGGEIARRLLQAAALSSTAALVASLLGLSASVALGCQFWNSIPDYFASYATFPAARSFASREVIRGLVCFVVMLPPTVFIGASYVLAMDIVTRTGDRPKTIVLGWSAAVNTLGNIAGVLLFGFLILPLLGGMDAGRAIAAAAFALALLVARLTGRPARWTVAAFLAAAVMLVGASRAVVNYDSLSTGANVYFFPQRWGSAIDHAESIDGGLTTVVEAAGKDGKVRTLLTNGKFQGNDALAGEMRAQIGFAMAPLLHQDQRERALVIGYGTGVTARVFHEANFRQVDVAELSGDVMRLTDKHFGAVNAGVSHAPRVAIHVTDGRNFLLLSQNKYDVISMEVSSIWFAGAAALYNREFYQLAKKRLQPDGVLQQWVQLHRLSPTDILQIVATLRSEFRYVSVYEIGSQGVLVATNAAERGNPVLAAVKALAKAPELAELRRIAGDDGESLLETRLIGPEGVDRYLSAAGGDIEPWISNDDNMRLEYDTPKANVNDPTSSFLNNRSAFLRFK